MLPKYHYKNMTGTSILVIATDSGLFHSTTGSSSKLSLKIRSFVISGLSPGFRYIEWKYMIFIMRVGRLGGKFYCTEMTDYHCLTWSSILGTKPR